ncbi:PspC domain-containing protein [Halalkalibacter hemicellulosilyticus]|uniref:PspC domain-containing protein n=1 Tax=Halalkalibacter hemicellulosilyticus TaxID=127886 RepID=UPI0005503B87|nr:PspC domain-containing protein [Halalkalibacter hemicellulosilyticus]
MSQKLTKSSTDNTLFGICGGIANFFGISPFIVRIIFIFTASTSLWIYIILAFALEDESSL